MANSQESTKLAAEVRRSSAAPMGQDPISERQSGEAQFGIVAATFFSYILCLLFFPLSLFFIVKLVNEYTRVVILRLGRVASGDARGPGLFFILPCIDDLRVVDLRTQVIDVPPQEILTKDSATVTVDAVLFFRYFHPVLSVTNVKNAYHTTWLLAQTTLRNVLGTFTLEQLIASRAEIATQMQTILDEATDPWGVKVERLDIKHVAMPLSMQRAMAAEAEATREAKAKVITAEGEQKASRALKEAASIMGRSKGSMQLRYLQTLHTVAAENNHTVMFPMPNDLISRFISAIAGKSHMGMEALTKSA